MPPRRFALLAAVLLVTGCGTPPAAPTTVAPILPPVPAEKSARYCKLVFGPKGESALWLTLDGDELRLGETAGGGDPAEKLPAEPPVRRKFRVKALREPGGGATHTDLIVSEESLSPEDALVAMGGGTILCYGFEGAPSADASAKVAAAVQSRIDSTGIRNVAARVSPGPTPELLILFPAPARETDTDEISGLLAKWDGLPGGVRLSAQPTRELTVGPNSYGVKEGRSFEQIEKERTKFVVDLKAEGKLPQTAITRFAADTTLAPELHFNGPLAMLAEPPAVETLLSADGERARLILFAAVGTRGVNVPLAAIPENALPIVEVVFQPDVKVRATLGRSPPGDGFLGTVDVPPTAKPGRATATFSFPAWKDTTIASATVEFEYGPKKAGK